MHGAGRSGSPGSPAAVRPAAARCGSCNGAERPGVVYWLLHQPPTAPAPHRAPSTQEGQREATSKTEPPSAATAQVAPAAAAPQAQPDPGLAPLDPATIRQLHATIRALPAPVLDGFSKAFRKRFQVPADTPRSPIRSASAGTTTGSRRSWCSTLPIVLRSPSLEAEYPSPLPTTGPWRSHATIVGLVATPAGLPATGSS